MHQKLATRPLGKTGLDISLLGIGGFHQLEVSQDQVDAVLARYLQAGGNYVETARAYGAGASESKIGRALRAAAPQERPILGSKTPARDREGAWRDINTALEDLGVDCVELFFFHGVQTEEEIDRIAGKDGALEAFEEARQQGMIRHICVSSHWPENYLLAAQRLPIETVLIWGNYLDFCNFPEIPNRVIPGLREKGIGILYMKPFGDGYLYRSPGPALRYALAQDGDCIVAGCNSLDQLETDLAICLDYPDSPVTEQEIQSILESAPELGNYVCRQCPECPVCEEPQTLKRIFELEGKYDRQMDDRLGKDAAQYALQERLKHWFQAIERAQQSYDALQSPAPRLAQMPLKPCPHGLDIPRKLQLAHAKLSTDIDLARF